MPWRSATSWSNIRLHLEIFRFQDDAFQNSRKFPDHVCCFMSSELCRLSHAPVCKHILLNIVKNMVCTEWQLWISTLVGGIQVEFQCYMHIRIFKATAVAICDPLRRLSESRSLKGAVADFTPPPTRIFLRFPPPVHHSSAL